MRTRPFHALPDGLISVGEARGFVLESIHRLPAHVVHLDEALGFVTAEGLISSSDVPGFANSAMDGYAVRGSDTAVSPVRLHVTGKVMAGSMPTASVHPGQAMRIMTGAPMPSLADAVVPVEQTRSEGDDSEVVVLSSVVPGTYVRHRGEDVRAGQEVFSAGTALSPSHIGVLAGLGITSVRVHRRPCVGVLSTGDELAEPQTPLTPGKIRDANRPTLLALVREAGYPAFDLGVVQDDQQGITAALRDGAAHCDVLLTSGGVSVGDVDFVRVVLDELSGGTMRWMQVAIKPAKPFAFGVLSDSGVPVFGLAGNPVSAVVGFELFARPALRAMAGHLNLDRRVECAIASVDFHRERDGKLHLVRVVAGRAPDGAIIVRPSGGQGSHMLLAMAQANALGLIPDGEGIRAGDHLDVLLLGDVGEPGPATILDPIHPTEDGGRGEVPA